MHKELRFREPTAAPPPDDPLALPGDGSEPRGPSCPFCKGSGCFQVDDVTVRQCVCNYARLLKMYLGPELSKAPNIYQSPLMVVPADGDPAKVVDLTRKNLFIRRPTNWFTAMPHIKWALACKGPTFRYRTCTDRELLDTWLGHKAYLTQPKKRREELETFNSLSDFVGEVSLLIVRLGFFGYPNVAASGVLMEAILHRIQKSKPTWVLEDNDVEFSAQHHTYSYEAEQYLKRYFEEVVLPDISVPVEKVLPAKKRVPPRVAAPVAAAVSTAAEPSAAEPSADVPVGGDVDYAALFNVDGSLFPEEVSTPKWKKKKWGKSNGSG